METPLGYTAVAYSHGDPAATLLQDQPLYELQQLIDGIDWVESIQSPGSGLR